MSASVDLGALATLFQQTLEPAQRKTAEAHLTQLESSAAASLCGTLLDLVAQPGAAPSVRLAAAIKLKNMARRAWAEDEESEAADSSLVPPAQRDVLKQRLLPLIAQLSSGAAQAAQSSASLRLQLADCVALIANKDFPERWPTLIDELVSGLALPPGSPALSAVLHTAHSIFRRWRAAFRSNELYTQIIFVLDRFASPFLDLLKVSGALSGAAAKCSLAALHSARTRRSSPLLSRSPKLPHRSCSACRSTTTCRPRTCRPPSRTACRPLCLCFCATSTPPPATPPAPACTR
jgi:hypothetical protein